MTNRVWPVDAVSGAPSYTGRALRQLIGTLITGGSAARPLGGRTGVMPGTSTTTITTTSSTCTIRPHSGILDVQTAAAAGAYMYAIDSNLSRSVAAADATNPRVDLVYVQLSDPAEGDGTSTPGVDIQIVTGTPAASPATPATPARSLVLATINVPKSGSGSPSVTWVAPNTSSAGGIIPTTGAAQYPPAPYVGQYIDDAALGLLRWDGSNWQTIGLGGDTGWQTCTLASGQSGAVSVRRVGNFTSFKGSLNKSGGWAAGDPLFTLPSTVFSPAAGASAYVWAGNSSSSSDRARSGIVGVNGSTAVTAVILGSAASPVTMYMANCSWPSA